MECDGTLNSLAVNLGDDGTVEDCFALAQENDIMLFGYQDKNKLCFGVTEDTAAMCEAGLVEDASGKWSIFEVWCSEGYYEGEVCSRSRIEKKMICDTDNIVTDDDQSLSAQDCLNLAYANMLETGVSVYSLNTKSDPKECRLPDQDDPDCSTSEGQLGPFNANPGKKAKIFEITCETAAYIGTDYYCGEANTMIGYAMVESGMKCGDTKTDEGFEATLAECNNFAMSQGSEWFSYREDQGICWHGNFIENYSCRNTGMENGGAWDVYAVCGEAPESLSDEQMKCLTQGKSGCEGEECWIAWDEDINNSWKCDGASNSHTGVSLEFCIEAAQTAGYEWVNWRATNGACAILEECMPTDAGSGWQIAFNCDNVMNN